MRVLLDAEAGCTLSVAGLVLGSTIVWPMGMSVALEHAYGTTGTASVRSLASGFTSLLPYRFGVGDTSSSLTAARRICVQSALSNSSRGFGAVC